MMRYAHAALRKLFAEAIWMEAVESCWRRKRCFFCWVRRCHLTDQQSDRSSVGSKDGTRQCSHFWSEAKQTNFIENYRIQAKICSVKQLAESKCSYWANHIEENGWNECQKLHCKMIYLKLRFFRSGAANSFSDSLTFYAEKLRIESAYQTMHTQNICDFAIFSSDCFWPGVVKW
jgi:hypothetical protein